MQSRYVSSRRFMRSAGLSTLALLTEMTVSHAQAPDIGSVDVQSSGAPATVNLPPLSSDAAIGSKAPPGSAPALAPTQGSLNSFEPGSTVSDKTLRDIIPPSSDYNEAAKFTPGYVSSNPNGLLGDAKGGWRGYQDGQYNITFDGIPFGDANDPTHHSAAYFPGSFLGRVVVDRGPGAASQVGYATFGGTLGLYSYDLSDVFGGHLESSYGTDNTLQSSIRVQTGLLDSGWRALFQYNHANTDGAVNYGYVRTDQFLGKADTDLGGVRLTLFGTTGFETYNNVNGITYPQLQAFGKKYGEVNNNPKSQEYVDYNNSEKQTDMEYVEAEGRIGPVHFDNKVYTYSYYYPNLQNNGNNQTIEGNSTVANGGSITSVSIPTLTGGKIKDTIVGVANGDVTGYIKNNNYRAYGDILKTDTDINAGVASGTVRVGLWVERIDNSRLQEYIDYTTGVTYPQLGNSQQASYKLLLASHIDNIQPYIEYEWKPLENLSITPGYKFESFTRDHDAAVNQTTLQQLTYTHTYNANLPFLAVRYKLTPEVTLYAQASQGFLAPTVSAYYVFDPTTGGIKPQTTTNYQAGIVYKTGKITADADIYQVTANNFPITNTTTTGETFYQNGGTARYQGIEAEGSYNIVNGLSVYASGALMSSKFIKGAFKDLRTGDAPDYTAAFGPIFDNGTFFGSVLQKFTGGEYGSSGQKQGSATTNAGLNFVPGYNTTDLVIGARFNLMQTMGLPNTITAKLGVYNVFDHHATTEISGDPTGLTSINNTTLLYSFQPGRLIYGSVGVDF